MRKNRPTRRSRSNPFRRLFDASSPSLRRAPRRRDIERLEERQVLSANVAGNDYFDNQWNLNATGQQTEFDPTSPTRTQTLAETDINVIDAWEQLATGSGVQVGIISGAFDLTHEDLVTAFQTDLMVSVLGGEVGFPATTDTAGTAVAGIIGARNNDLGVVGIAYDAELVPIRAISDGTDPLDTTQTETAVAQALRFRSGMVMDSDGDGVIDDQDPENIIDVYFVSGAVADTLEIDDLTGLPVPDAGGAFPGEVVTLPDDVIAAIEDGANAGRSTWTDLDLDGIVDIEEISSLGAIYVVPSGDDNGTTFNFPFNSTGVTASSQYNELANSRYTIAVGAVDYDGRYENNATGTVTSFSEMGANVLLVAPSGTAGVDLAADTGLNSGILTTDLTGDAGANANPDPFFGETDGGDFFIDNNYTSTFGGTEAAAAQVTAVVAQMLEVNPNLSRRDVEQILLMSAQTNDQFDESWITNPFGYFQNATDINPFNGENVYQEPAYVYTDIDVADDMGVFDGTRHRGRGRSQRPVRQQRRRPRQHQPVRLGRRPQLLPKPSERLNPDLTIDTFTYGLTEDPGFVALGSNLPTVLDGAQIPTRSRRASSRFTRTSRRQPRSSGCAGLDQPGQPGRGAAPVHQRGWLHDQPRPRSLPRRVRLRHGLLDAELAVQLAAAWAPDTSIDPNDAGLFKPQEVSISTPILDALLSTTEIQARATIGTGRGAEQFLIPGGINEAAINTAFYGAVHGAGRRDRHQPEQREGGRGDHRAPFYDPEGTLNFPPFTDGFNQFLLPIDHSVTTDFLSLEWVEVRSGVVSGDIDHLWIRCCSRMARRPSSTGTFCPAT